MIFASFSSVAGTMTPGESTAGAAGTGVAGLGNAAGAWAGSGGVAAEGTGDWGGVPVDAAGAASFRAPGARSGGIAGINDDFFASSESASSTSAAAWRARMRVTAQALADSLRQELPLQAAFIRKHRDLLT